MPLSLSYIVVGIIDGGFWTTAVAMQVRESTGTISWGGGFFQTFLNGNLQVWCVFLQNTRTAVVFFHADMLFPLSFACVCIYIYIWIVSSKQHPMNSECFGQAGEQAVLRASQSISADVMEELNLCHVASAISRWVDPFLTAGAWTICNATIIILAAP